MTFEAEQPQKEIKVIIFDILGRQIAEYSFETAGKYLLSGMDNHTGMYFVLILPNQIVLPIVF